LVGTKVVDFSNVFLFALPRRDERSLSLQHSRAIIWRQPLTSPPAPPALTWVEGGHMHVWLNEQNQLDLSASYPSATENDELCRKISHRTL